MPMLKLWRRHTPKCAHRDEGRDCLKCRCPLWADGEVGGKRLRRSLGTRDLQRAIRALAVLEETDSRPRKTVREAGEAFLAASPELAAGTLRNYKRIVAALVEFAGTNGIETIDAVTVEDLDRFRAFRGLSPLTWSKELQMLRGLFNFAMDRSWVQFNVGKRAKMPKNLKPKPKEPYTPEEIIAILGACDQIGQGLYSD